GCLSAAGRGFLIEESAKKVKGDSGRLTRVVQRVDLEAESRAPATDPSKRRVYRLVRRDAGDGPVTGRRGTEADVTIENWSISNAHAPFAHGARGWTVEDAGSTNGTFVDGDRVPARSPSPLSSSCVVRLGPEARFTFYEAKDLESYLKGLGAATG